MVRLAATLLVLHTLLVTEHDTVAYYQLYLSIVVHIKLLYQYIKFVYSSFPFYSYILFNRVA